MNDIADGISGDVGYEGKGVGSGSIIAGNNRSLTRRRIGDTVRWIQDDGDAGLDLRRPRSHASRRRIVHAATAMNTASVATATADAAR